MRVPESLSTIHAAHVDLFAASDRFCRQLASVGTQFPFICRPLRFLAAKEKDVEFAPRHWQPLLPILSDERGRVAKVAYFRQPRQATFESCRSIADNVGSCGK